MAADVIAGCILIAGSVCALVGMVWWCRRIIEYIARTGYRSAREIVKDKRGGR